MTSQSRGAAGALIVLCGTKYAELRMLDVHIEAAHTGNGGLTDLPRALVVDGTSISQNRTPPANVPAGVAADTT